MVVAMAAMSVAMPVMMRMAVPMSLPAAMAMIVIVQVGHMRPFGGLRMP